MTLHTLSPCLVVLVFRGLFLSERPITALFLGVSIIRTRAAENLAAKFAMNKSRAAQTFTTEPDGTL
jgi:hypothetical protein